MGIFNSRLCVLIPPCHALLYPWPEDPKVQILCFPENTRRWKLIFIYQQLCQQGFKNPADLRRLLRANQKRACGKSGRTTIRLNKIRPCASCASPNPLPSEGDAHCANPGDTDGSWAGITAAPLRDNGASHFIVLIILAAFGERWGEGKGGFSTELEFQSLQPCPRCSLPCAGSCRSREFPAGVILALSSPPELSQQPEHT